MTIATRPADLRVLHVLDHSLPIHSGYSFRSAAILAGQQSIGLDVQAITGPKHSERSADDGHIDGFTFDRTAYRNRFLKRLPAVGQLEVVRSLYHAISRMLAGRRFDVVHAHSPALNGLAAIHAAKLANVPVVYEMRASWEDAAVDQGATVPGSLRYRLSRALESRVFLQASAICTICNGLKKEVESRGVDPAEITVVPNAVDTDFFAPREDRGRAFRERSRLDRKFVIAFCGSFYFYEGLDLLLNAVADLERTVPDIVVLLAGGGEQDHNLRRQSEDLQARGVVRFLGRLPREQVVDIYNAADVCVFPRRSMKLTETVTPLKPLEVMACGALALASDVGGHKELIEDTQTGYMFQAGSTEALRDALVAVMQNRDHAAIRQAAREFVVNERTWASSVARYPDVYRRAIASSRGG